MPKGLLFWVIWILCLLAFVGTNFFGFGGPVAAHDVGGGLVDFILTGLLGWQVFGPPIQ